ncbi:RbsD/FucU domain-containing protein [Luteolibacter algae]|uniref:D-ribose pyranase n=1 Tax=Luteolibacter algae TaxID=454151 RepID=A0ABW5D9Y8_9BACT
MSFLGRFTAIILTALSVGCGTMGHQKTWQDSVNNQVHQLGYRNWIVIAEASFPAHNRPGIRQVNADAEIPEVLDYVFNALEETQHVKPHVYLTREMRAVENDFAPGINELRKKIVGALHGHESTELDQQSLVTLMESANQNFDVLVIRTPTALPYTSVFLELQPGYWDAESEDRLRERIRRERMDRVTRPIP